MAGTGAAMRYERVAYFNTGTSISPTWVRMGEGFETLDDSRNPEVDDTAYINDVAKTKTITAYGPEWAFDGTVIKENTVIEFLRAIGNDLSTGAAAESEIVLFDAWEVDPQTDIVDAKKHTVTVQMDSTGGGAGAEKLKFSGVLLGKGDPVDGTFDTVGLTFSEAIS